MGASHEVVISRSQVAGATFPSLLFVRLPSQRSILHTLLPNSLFQLLRSARDSFGLFSRKSLQVSPREFGPLAQLFISRLTSSFSCLCYLTIVGRGSFPPFQVRDSGTPRRRSTSNVRWRAHEVFGVRCVLRRRSVSVFFLTSLSQVRTCRL